MVTGQARSDRAQDDAFAPAGPLGLVVGRVVLVHLLDEILRFAAGQARRRDKLELAEAVWARAAQLSSAPEFHTRCRVPHAKCPGYRSASCATGLALTAEETREFGRLQRKRITRYPHRRG